MEVLVICTKLYETSAGNHSFWDLHFLFPNLSTVFMFIDIQYLTKTRRIYLQDQNMEI